MAASEMKAVGVENEVTQTSAGVLEVRGLTKYYGRTPESMT